MVDDPTALQVRADDKEAGHAPVDEISADKEEPKPDENAQAGVQKIEAVTRTWGRTSVDITLVLIWLLTLVNNMKTSIVYSLAPYATSSFLGHSLLTVIGIVASAMTAAVYIPMAKALDLWGRAEGFMLMVLLCITGLILLAAPKNIATYSAGQVCRSLSIVTASTPANNSGLLLRWIWKSLLQLGRARSRCRVLHCLSI
ncbi:hypothetical protein MAP00_004079 [Monascus purpureus]|nr:hypothetical protein MAP00_004079 [Monascus purpureus]